MNADSEVVASEMFLVKARGRQLRVVQDRLVLIRDVHGVGVSWEPLDRGTLSVTFTGESAARAFAWSYFKRILG